MRKPSGHPVMRCVQPTGLLSVHRPASYASEPGPAEPCFEKCSRAQLPIQHPARLLCAPLSGLRIVLRGAFLLCLHSSAIREGPAIVCQRTQGKFLHKLAGKLMQKFSLRSLADNSRSFPNCTRVKAEQECAA